LINDHALMPALAKRGREVVQREFSYEKFASIVHREVERALGEKYPLRDLGMPGQNVASLHRKRFARQAG
jgi:hypothetical protein